MTKFPRSTRWHWVTKVGKRAHVFKKIDKPKSKSQESILC